MTTNETMLALHKMMGGVGWEERHWRFTFEPAPDDYQYGEGEGGYWWKRMIDKDDGHVVDTATWFGHEAQALIEKAAIEWLSKNTTYLGIKHTPEQRWAIEWHLGDENNSFVVIEDTLLEALHAAVKESKDAEGD